MDGHIKLLVVVVIAIAIAAGLLFTSQQQAGDSNNKAPDTAGGQQPPKTGSPETFCATDGDCVPAQCCHPNAAINKNFAPACKGIFCTAACAPQTLDCGGGEIKCIKNKCEVVLK